MYGRNASEFNNWGNSPKEDVAMLHITGSMKTLKGELQSARGLLKDIIGTLQSVTPETNLTKAIGIFVIQMPEYKVFAKDSENVKQLLRKVCSGEISPAIAIGKLNESYCEVYRLLEGLENIKFLSNS